MLQEDRVDMGKLHGGECPLHAAAAVAGAGAGSHFEGLDEGGLGGGLDFFHNWCGNGRIKREDDHRLPFFSRRPRFMEAMLMSCLPMMVPILPIMPGRSS